MGTKEMRPKHHGGGSLGQGFHARAALFHQIKAGDGGGKACVDDAAGLEGQGWRPKAGRRIAASGGVAGRKRVDDLAVLA